MSKKTTIAHHTKESQQLNLEETVMGKIMNGEVSMKPRWYFILGSSLTGIGLVGLSIGAIFLTNLTFFLLRQHGRMGSLRLQIMIETFPWWIPALAVLSAGTGIFFLKKFDFSYKKNFSVIVTAFIAAIVLAAGIIAFTGINDTWLGQGRMQRLYQPIQQTQQNTPSSKIDAKTVEYLTLALADERKALATYQAIIEKFGPVKPFINIASSEEQHISMLLALFNAYEIEVPQDTTKLETLPVTLQEACAIGVTAEIENDALYQKMIPEIQEEDIKSTFISLAAASKEKHLPAFERCAQR